MDASSTLASAKLICEEVVASRGLDLVQLTFNGGVLALTIERPEGALPVDEIAEVSEEISRALDLQDTIAGKYQLEVASPGINRPLTRPKDFDRFTGSRVSVKTMDLIEGRRNFLGTITRAGDSTFVIDQDGMLVEIPYTAVGSARLKVDWDAVLKDAVGNKTSEEDK